MVEIREIPNRMQITQPDHLQVVATFVAASALLILIDRIVPNEMDVSIGTIAQGMVLDTLSGRSPLYRLEEFFEHQDTQLLLGQEVNPTSFDDTTVDRALGAFFNIGVEKVFSEVAFAASCVFPLGMRYVHFDTTSVNVWGNMDHCVPNSETINITYGYSKDHRPDLKQFLVKMFALAVMTLFSVLVCLNLHRCTQDPQERYYNPNLTSVYHGDDGSV